MAARRPKPALVMPRGEIHAFALQLRDSGLQVVAHEVERMPAILRIGTGGMNAKLGGRQREDEPTMSGIHGRKSEDVAKEGTIRFRVPAIDDSVHSVDHAFITAAARRAISSGATSSMCVAIHQVLPDASSTPAPRSP